MKSPTNTQLKNWAMLTDANEHGKVRVQIAEWFQQTNEWKTKCRIHDYALAFSFVNELHEQQGGLPFELSVIRNILTHAMLEDIAIFSRQISETICQCL